MRLAPDSCYAYYFSRISPAHRETYRHMYRGLHSRRARIHVQTQDRVDTVHSILAYVLLDHPKLFFVDASQFDYRASGNAIELRVRYLYSRNAIRGIQELVDESTASLLSAAPHRSTCPLHMERFLYQTIARNTRYSGEEVARAADHSILGPLLNGTAVCEGYAKALKYLCDAVSLPCIVARGTASGLQGEGAEPHAWNILKLQGKYYHCDVTWDSILGGDEVLHPDYFNLSDEEMRKDHTWGADPLPLCNHTYTDVPYVVDQRDFARRLHNCLTQGERRLAVRFRTFPERDSDIVDLVCSIIDRFPAPARAKVSNVKVRYNRTQNKALITFL